jgi:LCP family protein required for cell wall assembly
VRRRLATGAIATAVGVAIVASLAVHAVMAVSYASLNLGRDNRLTVLLIGSDERPPGQRPSGERTDAMMIVSIDPNTKRVVASSIPRDIAKFPRYGASSFGCTRSSCRKVNTHLQYYDKTLGMSRGAALLRFKNDVATALQAEIDYYALLQFGTFQRLVTAIGGIDVYLPTAYRDSSYQWRDALGRHRTGIYFPKGRNRLNGAMALILARVRKADSDFARGSRQQLVVMAAVRKMASLPPTRLPAVLGLASRMFETNIPAAAFPALYSLVSKANFGSSTGCVAPSCERVVYKPRTYAAGHTCCAAYILKLAAVRSWANRYNAVAKDTTAPTLPGSAAVTPAGRRGDAARLTLRTRISWGASSDAKTGLGRYRVQVGRWNGKAYAYADVPLAFALDRQLLKHFGSGRYRARVRGVDGVGNKAAPASTDWRYTSPWTVGFHQERATRNLVYANAPATPATPSQWTRTSVSGASARYVMRTTRKGAAATFTFTGRAFTLVGTRGRSLSYGTMKVYLKTSSGWRDLTPTPVSNVASATQLQRTLWTMAWPTSARRTIKVVNNTANRRLDIDAYGFLQ